MRRVLLFAAGLCLVSVVGAEAGKPLVSPPLLIEAGQDFSCSVANTGTKDLDSVNLVIHLDAAGTSIDQTCSPLAAGSACTATGFASGAYRRWCSVTGGSKKSVRGTFCNDTTGVCVEIH